MSVQCSACGSENRDGARFCRSCGKPLATLPPPPIPTPPEPPKAATRIPPVPPGTVVREELKTPGTVLQSQRDQPPVCGWLVIMRGRRKGRDFRIDKDTSVLGRDGSCDYAIEDDLVSRQHARIRIEDGKFVLFDLGSGNGTYVNGEAINRADLQDGDVLKVGDTLILFKDAKPRLPLDHADPAGARS